jgi:SAM-dependent methyltransferase
LDVGCGFGDFLDFLLKRGDRPALYVGIDQNDEFVGKCAERFGLKPGRTFLTNSIETFSKEHAINKFDWVIAIGVAATVPTRTTGPDLDVFELMTLMWQHAKEGIAFTCLSTVDYGGKLNSHDPGTVLNWTLSLTPHVSFFHDYGEQEFTVIARRCANRLQR